MVGSCYKPCLGAAQSRPLHQRSPRQRHRLLAVGSVRGSEAPESRQGSEFQQLLPGKRQRQRATFIQDQLHRSERAHNAPLLPPPETPPPSFRGQRERQRSSLQGWEGVKATAKGRGASSIAPPHRDRRTLLGQLCASAGGLVRVPAE